MLLGFQHSCGMGISRAPCSGPVTPGVLCAFLHTRQGILHPQQPLSQAACSQTLLQEHTHVSNGPDRPGLLVGGSIALVCFALNGEPRPAWQFLPSDTWQIFFCGPKISLPDATGGSAPLALFAGGAHPSLLHPFLSCSEATCHLPRRHSTALNSSSAGYGCSCAMAQGTGGNRANPPPTKDPKKQTALASGEMKLLKNLSLCQSASFFYPETKVEMVARSVQKSFPKTSRNLSFLSQNRIMFWF